MFEVIPYAALVGIYLVLRVLFTDTVLWMGSTADINKNFYYGSCNPGLCETPCNPISFKRILSCKMVYIHL